MLPSQLARAGCCKPFFGSGFTLHFRHVTLILIMMIIKSIQK
jgi:hypothetical protein